MTTVAERRHMTAVAALGCIVCLKDLGVYSPAIIHHVRTINGNRTTRNHMLVLPLCPFHHRHDSGIGNGFHAGTRTWQLVHGTEVQLMEAIADLLNLGEIAS